ncbi:hypothetical protein CPB83DRAFT_906518 [Crepidotus variabilis]|uniref:Uncharacterized protein n=1 Tax=Crepidotus variabilis TaxID=179855 RepID=A0A9P6JQ16_9AGAR|nr:hypothetical protein CPB83DRAFT_906518 [Crepidotus variabilis]
MLTRRPPVIGNLRRSDPKCPHYYVYGLAIRREDLELRGQELGFGSHNEFDRTSFALDDFYRRLNQFPEGNKELFRKCTITTIRLKKKPENRREGEPNFNIAYCVAIASNLNDDDFRFVDDEEAVKTIRELMGLQGAPGWYRHHHVR